MHTNNVTFRKYISRNVLDSHVLDHEITINFVLKITINLLNAIQKSIIITIITNIK